MIKKIIPMPTPGEILLEEFLKPYGISRSKLATDIRVPANRIGFIDNGGPFNLWQLKVIQEFLSLTVFTVFMLLFFKDQPFTFNHFIGFCFLILAVYFIFKK